MFRSTVNEWLQSCCQTEIFLQNEIVLCSVADSERTARFVEGRLELMSAKGSARPLNGHQTPARRSHRSIAVVSMITAADEVGAESLHDIGRDHFFCDFAKLKVNGILLARLGGTDGGQ